jgi:hypothetical protein
MILWGGHADGGIYFNDGSRYDPVADRWTAMTPTVAPEPRSFATAVWTGLDMIVWGGQRGGWYQSGGRYRPSTNTWSATSLGNHVPWQRSGHTAVWTGTEMIIWGPTAGDGDYLDNGGRYCSCAAIPPSFTSSLVASKSGSDSSISWDPVAGATGYDVVEGNLDVLRSSGGDFTSALTSCIGSHVPGTTVNTSSVPAAGSGLWHLVRGVNCAKGTWDEGVASQQGSRDAEIAASGSACP